MAGEAGTASGASSTQGQGQSAAQTDWQQEKAGLEAELQSRDQQIRALASKNRAWEQNVGRELEGHLEFDQFGNPIRVKVDDTVGNGQPAYTGNHPLTGLVDDPRQVDSYYATAFGSRFATPQQLQEQVNRAKLDAYNAARADFLTLRTVDRTVSDPRYKELSAYDSPLSKKTLEILQRNGWGQPVDATSRSWDQVRYSDPNALPIAAQIAKAEMFEAQQQTQQSQSQAQSAQAAAGIAGAGGSASAVPATRTPEEMAKLFSENPAEYDRIIKEDFIRATQGAGR